MKYKIHDDVRVDLKLDDGEPALEIEAIIIDYIEESQTYIVEDEDCDVFEVSESQILEVY